MEIATYPANLIITNAVGPYIKSSFHGPLRSISGDQCAFSSAVMSTELEVPIEKKGKVFLKRLLLFF